VVGLLLAALFGALIGSLVGFAVDLYVSTQSVVLTTDSTWTTDGAPLGAVTGPGAFAAVWLRARRTRN
jgi:hypothetical protein